jgi:hypothetical protein
MSQAKVPHTAIIHLTIDVYPNLPTGECAGQPILVQDVPRTRVIEIKGFDRYDTIKKLKEKLNELSH